MEARRVDGKFKVNFNTPTPRRLVDLLPEVRAEDLNERNLQRRNLAVHEDARQVELDLEADVDVGAVDRRAPPEREAPVRDLVEATALRVRQLLVLHQLLEAARLLPEEALPGREVGALEQRVLQNALDAPQGLDHVRPVVVQIPQFTIVALVRPPACALRDAVRTDSKSKRRPPRAPSRGDEYKGRRTHTRRGSAVILDIA